MSSRDIDTSKDILLQNLQTINKSDTISQFVDKCNHNFSKIVELGGGTAGVQGEQGTQGVPVKPKVAIHAWREGSDFEYYGESTDGNGGYIMVDIYEDLTNEKYQIGHLIILQNGHVYILKENTNTFDLTPIFIFAMQSFDPNTIIDGKSSYLHIAYADNANGDNLVTDRELNGDSNEMSTFNLMRNVSNVYSNSVDEKPYMGIYSDFKETSSTHPERYTWIRVRGKDGKDGEDFTSQLFYIDLEGDMSTISLNNNRTRLYEGDYCECIAHAYYGNKNFKLNTNQVSIKSLSEGYDVISNVTQKENETEIRIQYDGSYIGSITITQKGNDVAFRFTPDPAFSFPKNDIIFSIHVEADVNDENSPTTYSFIRDTVWAIKGIVSTFELEIIPQYRTIKLFDGGRYPEKLSVFVYKTVNGEREIFDFSKNRNFKLLYKNYNDNNWRDYRGAVDTKDVSCLEFKVVKNLGAPDEEIWDYEDVWAVADGKSVHYYHADLGNTESMMVLTTGAKQSVETTNHGTQYCAVLRNESGYTITFDPKFYDGSEELEVTRVDIEPNSNEEYFQNETFVYNLSGNTLTISRVPYDIEMIPMNLIVTANCPVYDKDGEIKEHISKYDTVSFNVYVSTQSDIYTLEPTPSSYNTSTGQSGKDTIGCAVYKNNNLVEISDLNQNALKLKYIVHDNNKKPVEYEYSEPLVYGDDSDISEDEFTASDVAIEFILYYRDKEVVRSTVPLIKDGIDGRDGDTWQYIFCRSPKYPFDKTGISNPNLWQHQYETNPDSEYLGDKETGFVADSDKNWYDDHRGINGEYRYEYQSYRKWDKDKKQWGPYGEPTLYSNYSENGSGYNVILSNPISVIPVGDKDWSVDEDLDCQTDYTFIYLYNNATDITSEKDNEGNNKISISLPNDNIYVQNGNFTVDNDTHKVSFIPVVGESIFDFESNKQYKLPITLTYNLGKDGDGDSVEDKFETTINWILSPMKGFEDIEVFVDKRIVNTSISKNHTFKVGYYLLSSNNNKNNKKFIGSNDVETNTKRYQIKITDDISKLSDVTAVEDWSNAPFDFTNIGENKNCYVVLVDSDGSTIIDYVNITAVIDGASAMHLELTQDYIAVPASVDGNSLHQDFISDENLKIQSQMILYNGDTEITEGITYSFYIDGEDASSYIIENNKGTFTVDKITIKGDTNIECVATYDPTGASFHKTLFIDVESTPYELEIDKNTLSRKVVSVGENGNIEDGYIVDNSINVKVKYWKNGSWCYVTDGDVRVEYSRKNSDTGAITNESSTFDKDTSKDYPYRLEINDRNIKKNTIDLEVKIVYVENDDTLSYENIGIINNGVDGKDGVTKFKSTVFTRSDNNPEWPKDGSFDDPNPSNSDIWEDGIPEGNESIWSSYRWFSNAEGFESDWSEPVKMCDNADFEVMYSSLDDITDCNPNEATTFYRDADDGIEGWLNETGLINKWSDDGGTNSIWMATINKTNGKWGKWTISKIKGENGKAPSCTKVEILGYSLDSNASITNMDDWKDSVDKLDNPSPGQAIYILNRYYWSDLTTTLGITVTLAGTQGVDGKSRVLFYLGSFEKGKATLSGDSIVGRLNNEICDYYIDRKGQAWRRIGEEEEKVSGFAGDIENGASDLNDEVYWQKADTVGFLKSGAIHADMINTGSLVADEGFITKLTSNEIFTQKLQVDAANITGTLTIGSGENDVKIDGELAADNIPTITSTMIADDAITTGKILANSITANEINISSLWADQAFINELKAVNIEADNLKVKAANITDTLSADKINVDNLTVMRLDTQKAYSSSNPDGLTHSQVRIEDNEILVTANSDNPRAPVKPVLKISGESVEGKFTEDTNYTYIREFGIENDRAHNQFWIGSGAQGNSWFNSEKNSLIKPILSSNGNIINSIPIPILIPTFSSPNYSKTKIFCDSKSHPDGIPDMLKIALQINSCKTEDNMSSYSSAGFKLGICCVVKDINGEIITYGEYKRLNDNSIYIKDGHFVDPNVIDINPTGYLTKEFEIPFDTIFDHKYADPSKYTIQICLFISNISYVAVKEMNISYILLAKNDDGVYSDKINIYTKPLVGTMPNVNIYRNTFRYFVDSYNYLNIDEDGYFTYYGPGMVDGFGVNKEDGVWFYAGGQKFKLSDLNENIHKASESYKKSISEYDGQIKTVKVDIYGEDGTGGLKFDMYGADGKSGLVNYAVTTSGTGDNSFTKLFNTNVSNSKTIVTTSETGDNSFTKLFNTNVSNSNTIVTTTNASVKLEDTFKSSSYIKSVASSANTAITNASTAISKANTAISNADTAITNANTAATTAQKAIDDLNELSPYIKPLNFFKKLYISDVVGYKDSTQLVTGSKDLYWFTGSNNINIYNPNTNTYVIISLTSDNVNFWKIEYDSCDGNWEITPSGSKPLKLTIKPIGSNTIVGSGNIKIKANNNIYNLPLTIIGKSPNED